MLPGLGQEGLAAIWTRRCRPTAPNLPVTTFSTAFSTAFASGYEPPKFRRGIGFQDGNQRRSMPRADLHRVQHAGLALPNRMAGKFVTQARQLITAIQFHLLNLRPDLISRVSGDAPSGPTPRYTAVRAFALYQ